MCTFVTESKTDLFRSIDLLKIDQAHSSSFFNWIEYWSSFEWINVDKIDFIFGHWHSSSSLLWLSQNEHIKSILCVSLITSICVNLLSNNPCRALLAKFRPTSPSLRFGPFYFCSFFSPRFAASRRRVWVTRLTFTPIFSLPTKINGKRVICYAHLYGMSFESCAARIVWYRNIFFYWRPDLEQFLVYNLCLICFMKKMKKKKMKRRGTERR